MQAETCTVCGRAASVIGYSGAPRCADHGIGQLHSKDDIDRIAALEAENAALRAQVAALPRPVIMAFARIMEAKLATKDALGYPDWRQETPLQHLSGMFQEWVECKKEIFANDGDGSRDAEARWEAVDVALRAMMLCDVLEPLCEHDGRGRVQGSHA